MVWLWLFDKLPLLCLFSFMLIVAGAYVRKPVLKWIRHRNFRKPYFLLAMVVVAVVIFIYIIQPFQSQRSRLLSQIDGAWLASDDSMRVHFFIRGKETDLVTYVTFADTKTGKAQILPYNTNITNVGLIFSQTAQPDLTTDDIAPANFELTKINGNSITLSLGDKSLDFIKEDYPAGFADLPAYGSKYSIEEYLSVAVGMMEHIDMHAIDPLFDISEFRWPELDVTLEPKDGDFNFHISSLVMSTSRKAINNQTEEWLEPGVNSSSIVGFLHWFLWPVNSSVGFIYCNEVFKADNGTASWTGKYTMTSLTPEIIADNASGLWVEEHRYYSR